MLITIILISVIIPVFGISFWTVYSLNRDYEKVENLMLKSQSQCKNLRIIIRELQDEIEAKTVEEREPVSSIDN